MNSSNSAHDPISILVDETELADIYKVLSEKANQSVNDSYTKMIQTLDTLNAFALAEEAGDAHFHEVRVELESDNSDCHVVLETRVLDEAGWTKHLRVDNEEVSAESLNKADLAMIKRGEFTMDVEPPDTLPNLTVDELLSLMDDFQVGRPSTFANTLEGITKETSLLDLTDDNARLTQLGYRLSSHLDSMGVEEFSAVFCKNFSKDLQNITVGIMSPTEVLLQYLPLVANSEDIEAFKTNAWRTLSDIDIKVY